MAPASVAAEIIHTNPDDPGHGWPVGEESVFTLLLGGDGFLLRLSLAAALAKTGAHPSRAAGS
ncbi:hypothetical protein ABZ614_41155 [Streptomyces sp. NPDC013178]|uniref:hypothetical protein n=1 Tax=Streptomyces sp. NPDC013178 TaxID=3155118 RepID=UPI0033C91BF2